MFSFPLGRFFPGEVRLARCFKVSREFDSRALFVGALFRISNAVGFSITKSSSGSWSAAMRVIFGRTTRTRLADFFFGAGSLASPFTIADATCTSEAVAACNLIEVLSLSSFEDGVDVSTADMSLSLVCFGVWLICELFTLGGLDAGVSLPPLISASEDISAPDMTNSSSELFSLATSSVWSVCSCLKLKRLNRSCLVTFLFTVA